MNIDNNHRAFAQALLIEAIDASKKLEVMKEIAEFAYGHNPRKLIKILEAVSKAAEVIYEYKKPTEISKKLIDDSELLLEVINQLRKNFKSEIDNIINGEGNIYLDSSLKQNDKKTKLSDNHELENLQNKTAEWKLTPLNIEQTDSRYTQIKQHIENILNEKFNALDENDQHKLIVDFIEKKNQHHLEQAKFSAVNCINEEVQEKAIHRTV